MNEAPTTPAPQTPVAAGAGTFASVTEQPGLGPETMSPEEERRLIRETVAGNTQAFGVLVQSHHRRIHNFLHHMTRHRQDAEDLTQDTFVKAYRHLARFDPERPLINWLLTIARHTALNHFRDHRPWDEIPAETAGSEPSPARAAETSDRTHTLWDRARSILSPREFEVLWLRFAEELSTEETARVVGLTQTHVKVIVFRARKALLKGQS